MCDKKQSNDENNKKENSEEKKCEGDEDVNTVVEHKSVKSTEIDFQSDKEYDKFVDYIENPPASSQFVKDLIKEYREQSGS